MYMTVAKWQHISIIVLVIVCLLAYVFFAQKVMIGSRAKYMFLPAIALAVILLLMKLPLIKIFQVFILTIPLESTLVMDVGFRITLSYLMLLFLLFIMLISREIWYTKSPLDFALMAYLISASFSLVQNIISPPPSLSLEASAAIGFRASSYRSLIQLALLYFLSLFYFVTVHICNNKKHLDIVIKTYIIVGVIIASYGIYQAFATQFNLPLKAVTNSMRTSGKGYGSLFTEVSIDKYRSQATFGEPLGFGQYLLSLIPLSLTFGAMTRSHIDLAKRRWMTGKGIAILITIFIFALFMTRSRGALIGFGASVMAIILLLGMKNIKSFIIYISIAVFILIVSYLIAIRYLGFNSDILELLRFRGNVTKQMQEVSPLAFMLNPRSQRYVFYFVWVPMLFRRHPFVGVGLGNFNIIISNYLESTDVLISPAGVWGTVLAETGLFGIITFSSMVITYYVVMIRALRKHRNTHFAPYLIGLTGCYTGIMVQYISCSARLGVFTWFIMGISMALINHIRKTEKESSNIEGLANNVVRS